MKKSFKVLAIAAVASLTLVACNNNNTEATDTIDSTAIEQVAEEEIVAEPAEVLDTTPVVEEKAATAVKKTVKAVKQEVKKDEIKVAEQTEAVKREVTELPSKKAANMKKRL